MSNQILRIILVASSILVLALFLMYRSFDWPLGTIMGLLLGLMGGTLGKTAKLIVQRK